MSAVVTTGFVGLESVLRQNEMDPRQPLSPHAYDLWRRSLESKREEVVSSARPGGLKVFTLKTISTGSIAVGSIEEARFVVRANDWHPIEEYWRIRGKGGDEEYELSETAFEVVSLSALSPTFFGESQVTSLPLQSTKSTITATSSPSLAAKSTPPALGGEPRSASIPDLEVEVLLLLNQSGANLGEQISVTRTTEGKLYVQGIVDTDRRKAEILKALESVINNPAVLVQVNTVAEVVKSGKKSDGRVAIQGGQISENSTIPAYPELRSYFLKRGVSNGSDRRRCQAAFT